LSAKAAGRASVQWHGGGDGGAAPLPPQSNKRYKHNSAADR
jgi:hypothetical protein